MTAPIVWIEVQLTPRRVGVAVLGPACHAMTAVLAELVQDS